jgi:hypothetical protein
MAKRAAMAARVVPVDWAALVAGQRQAALTAMAARVVPEVTVVSLAAVQMETRLPWTGDQAAPVVTVVPAASAVQPVVSALPELMDLMATEARVDLVVMVLHRAPQVSMAATEDLAASAVAQQAALPAMAATEALVVLVLMEQMARRRAVLMD